MHTGSYKDDLINIEYYRGMNSIRLIRFLCDLCRDFIISEVGAFLVCDDVVLSFLLCVASLNVLKFLRWMLCVLF